MKHILFAVAMMVGLSGCAYKSQISDLETQVAQLSQDKEDVCAVTVELMAGGMALYVGNNVFVHRITGEEVVYDDMVVDCETMLGSFREVVVDRQKNRQETSAPAE